MPQYSLTALRLIDAPPEPAYDNLARTAATALDAPAALVSIVDRARDRQFFKSQLGVPEPWASRRETPLSHSFCRHVVERDATLVVDDARTDPIVADSPAVEALGVVAYLGAPVRTPTGRPLGALCVADERPRHWTPTDVAVLEGLAACATEAMALRAALNASEGLRAEQADFAYALSHDLRSPIGSVRAVLDELASDPGATLRNTARELVELGARTAARAQALVDEVTRYAASVERPATSTAVALGALAAEVVEDLRPEIEAAAARVRIAPLPEVDGDETQLALLLRHLLANAIRYRRPGTAPSVIVDARRADRCVEVAVRDDGIGIEPQHHERIFGLFQRLHTEHELPGSGLGLALCRRVAANHGGTLEVASARGAGATFTLRLPERSTDRQR